MTDNDMTVALALGVAGYLSIFAVALAVIYLCTRKTPVPTPDPAFRAPVMDAGLVEDNEVAELDALWELDARDPRISW